MASQWLWGLMLQDNGDHLVVGDHSEGDNCDLTPEQNQELRREQNRRHILAIKERRANKPRPLNKSKFTHFRVPVTVTYSDCLPYDTIPPQPRVLPAGFLARAKVPNKDLGVSSEENQKIYQSPLISARSRRYLGSRPLKKSRFKISALNLGSDILGEIGRDFADILKSARFSRFWRDFESYNCAVLDEVDILFKDEDFQPALQSFMNLSPVTTQYLFVTATLPVDVYNKLMENFLGTLVFPMSRCVGWVHNRAKNCRNSRTRGPIRRTSSSSTRDTIRHISCSRSGTRDPITRISRSILKLLLKWEFTIEGKANGFIKLIGVDVFRSTNFDVIESLQGALGLRPYVPASSRLYNLTARWHHYFYMKYPTSVTKEVPVPAIRTIPYEVPYVVISYDNATYDDLVQKVYNQEIDTVVGDSTILPNRSEYVDFTATYSDLGVGTVGKIKEHDMWFLLEPLHWGVWLTAIGSLITTCIEVKDRLLETLIWRIVKGHDDSKPWPQPVKAEVGRRLVELLLQSAYIQPLADQSGGAMPPDIRPAFTHTFRTSVKEGHGGFIVVSRYASATHMPPSILSRGTAGSENAGLLALTRVGSQRVIQISAGFMIFFSILGHLSMNNDVYSLGVVLLELFVIRTTSNCL
ncbi:Extracellular ligand-binding receptor [Artemisia annua]|uniref:Extracellular ligand-binding receptor n=1 Tax=Artemisia annua TaxID=35608 RepID=A0A2U1NCY2_ARTAN|nr:Extracellular ligand-binding receptor [Artemisia annua]